MWLDVSGQAAPVQRGGRCLPSGRWDVCLEGDAAKECGRSWGYQTALQRRHEANRRSPVLLHRLDEHQDPH